MGGVLLWRWGGVRGGRSASVEVGRGGGMQIMSVIHCSQGTAKNFHLENIRS